MCGRAYQTFTEEELFFRYINQRGKRRPLGLSPNYNMAPTHICPVVLVRDGEIQIQLFRWGLVPFWSKDIKSASKFSLINARVEEITEKRSYKQSFERRRCIVPLSGFYEWKRETEKIKRPFAIHFKDEPIMSAAGIWEHWKSPEDGSSVESFSILTTAANPFMENIHDRMPVFLDPEAEMKWLDPGLNEPAKILELVRPTPSSKLDAHEVSTLVNSPKNNVPEVLRAIGSAT